MKRTIISISAAVLAATTSIALVPNAIGATPAAKSSPAPKDACASQPSKFARLQCENFSHSAPGDMYFGRMKLSFLGINNTFRDEAISAGAYTTDSNVISKVAFADDALRQWSSRYPGDPQLARSYFLAIQTLKKIYTQSAQQEAWQYMHVLTSRFPTSYFGKLEKIDLAKGFTEHWFTLPQACPTAMPSGAPESETTPGGTPTPSPAPGQPKLELITSPCVQQTPAAVETPSEPEASPTAAPSTAPTATPKA